MGPKVTNMGFQIATTPHFEKMGDNSKSERLWLLWNQKGNRLEHDSSTWFGLRHFRIKCHRPDVTLFWHQKKLLAFLKWHFLGFSEGCHPIFLWIVCQVPMCNIFRLRENKNPGVTFKHPKNGCYWTALHVQYSLDWIFDCIAMFYGEMIINTAKISFLTSVLSNILYKVATIYHQFLYSPIGIWFACKVIRRHRYSGASMSTNHLDFEAGIDIKDKRRRRLLPQKKNYGEDFFKTANTIWSAQVFSLNHSAHVVHHCGHNTAWPYEVKYLMISS